MAVFTPVTEADARELLQRYDLGELVSLRGITAGIENTNYFLTTTTGEFVLTLFEKLDHDQLPFYIELMHHLAAHGVPVPQPQTLRDGTRLTALHSKPTAVVSRLDGGYEPAPTDAHCRLAAHTQAQAHLAARDFSHEQPNLRGLDWWQATVPGLLEFLDADQTALLTDELEHQVGFHQSACYRALPRAAVHCDLFRDNVLFAGTVEQPVMGGFIDFYFAGVDTLLFDVAVAANDWCIERESGAMREAPLRAWLRAYETIRPFTTAEREAWPHLLRAAALRFWISRLYDFHQPRTAETLQPHDPRHFERILRLRRDVAVMPLP